jgi:hypothetical protein
MSDASNLETPETLEAVIETVCGNVSVLLGFDAEGNQYVRLEGNGCALEGVEPCLYYPTPVASA